MAPRSNHASSIPPTDDPVMAALASAPFDDEPESSDEAAAVEHAREQLSRGEVVAHEDVMRALGLAP